MTAHSLRLDRRTLQCPQSAEPRPLPRQHSGIGRVDGEFDPPICLLNQRFTILHLVRASEASGCRSRRRPAKHSDAVGIGLLEASCVDALIARRAPNFLVSLDRRCIHICRTRCLVQAGQLIIQAGQLLVSADRLLNEGGCLRAVEARSPRRRNQNEIQKDRPHRQPHRSIPFSSSPEAIIAEFARAARRRFKIRGK